MSTGVVDASRLIASILAGYRGVVAEYQRQVTGDPDALTAMAQRRNAQAATVSGKSGEIIGAATALHGDWDGDAYAAFAAAGGKLGVDLRTVGARLNAQAAALTAAANVLRAAKSSVDSVLRQFDQYANQLISQSRTAAAEAVDQFISAAQRLGESAVAAAKGDAGQLDAALERIFPAEGETEIGRLEHELGKTGGGALHWLNGEPLDGRRRPRSAISGFDNFGGWKKLTWDGLRGTRDPLKKNTPFGAEPESAAGKLWGNTEITYWKTKHEQDGAMPGWDLKVASQGWQAKADGHAELALVNETTQGKLEYGVASASAKGTAFLGGEVNGSLTGGAHGAGAHVNAFAGGKVEGEVAADVAGVGAGVNGTLQYGVGFQGDAQFVYEADHLKANFKAGAALGLGFGVGAKLDIDLPKVYHTVSEYGGEAVDAVSSAAGEAANAVGSAWHDAAAYAGAR